MSFKVRSVIEGKPRSELSGLNRIFRISLKQLLVLILVIVVASGSFLWASGRIETHKRWAAMLEMSQQFMIHFDEVYVRLPSIMKNETPDPTHYWLIDELDYADWAISQLARIDTAHESELFSVEIFVWTLQGSATTGIQLNSSQFLNLSSAIHTIAYKLPQAYWNPLNTTSINTETGPPFWYFGPSPPDEAILQQMATLATQAKEIITPSA